MGADEEISPQPKQHSKKARNPGEGVPSKKFRAPRTKKGNVTQKPGRGEEGETVEVGDETPSTRGRVSRPLPPSLRGEAPLLEQVQRSRGNAPVEVEEQDTSEVMAYNPSQINIHEIDIPEELQTYQRGCLLKVRKVGNSRFSQEMTRYANQRFIKKLGRGQYFIPDYFILAEIQGWADKWETTLLLTPVSDDLRDLHMQDIRSKISARGEDLPKKVQELEHTLRMSEDRFIKMEMATGQEKADLQQEIENLHTQLDEAEAKIDELQAQLDDVEVGTGAAEISQLRDRVQSLEEERDDFDRLYQEARDKMGHLQVLLDASRTQGGQASSLTSSIPETSPESIQVMQNPLENISDEDAAELGDLSDLLLNGGDEEERDEEPDTDDLKAAQAYKKPQWDDEDGVLIVENDEDVEMTDEELEEYERELKERESKLDDDDGDDE